MPITKTVVTSAPKFKRCSYTVAMSVEFYKEMLVSAETPEEAQELAEMRVRARQKNLHAGGYSLGDIEFLNVTERG